MPAPRQRVLDALALGGKELSCPLRIHGTTLSASGRELRIPEAVDRVVVDQPARLHERVTDRRADEAEASLLQILAHRLRLSGLRGQLRELAPLVHERLAVDEAPEVVAQAPVELGDALRVVHRRLDLQPV